MSGAADEEQNRNRDTDEHARFRDLPEHPEPAAMATANSARLNRAISRSLCTSTRPVIAASTIAARAGNGRSRRSPVRKRTTTSAMSAAKRPERGVRRARGASTSDWAGRHSREARAEAGHEVGAANRQELPRRVEAIPALGGVHAPDGDVHRGKKKAREAPAA